jgi:hypothetical protein
MDENARVAAIEGDYPRWRVWQSADTGKWWAALKTR